MNEVRLIDTQTGNYTRPVKDSDLDFITQCTRDWPNGGWSRPHARNVIENSIDNNYDNPLDGTMPITKLVVVFCLSDDTPVGFTSYTYHLRTGEGEASTAQTHYAAMLPSYRGQGLFSEFTELMTWSLLEFSDVETYVYSSIENSASSEIWNAKALARGSEKHQTKSTGLARNPKTNIVETRAIIDTHKKVTDTSRFQRTVVTV